MPEPNTGCWIWIGGSGHYGYGAFYFRPPRKMEFAHRVSYTLYRGEIPEGKHILHTCDNPFCVNPDHLFIGTPLDNMRDKMKKGRHVAWKSDECNLSKLTTSKVLEIKKLIKDGLNNRQIGNMFDVIPETIWHIRHGKTWKKV